MIFLLWGLLTIVGALLLVGAVDRALARRYDPYMRRLRR